MRLIYSFLFVLLTTPIYAQVTIGSGIAPMKGALLDLKEENSLGGATASRGLGLPRVSLTSKTNLFPMFKENDSDYIGKNKDEQDLQHIGLLVYHIQQSLNAPEANLLASGLYVWNGKEWYSLSIQQNKEEDKKKDFALGKSGTKYKTRVFGKAGEWMIENLRETEYDEGEPHTRQPVEKISTPYTEYVAYYHYPKGDKKLFNKNPQYGLLYSYTAATNGRATDRNGDKDRSSQVQGICPSGWLVPSRLDWRNLREELEKNPELYSDNKDGRMIGYTAKSPKKVEESRYNTNGASRDNGLNILMVGAVKGGYSNDYGRTTVFWTSSLINDQHAYVRELQNDYNYSYNDYHSDFTTSMFSIRCIKKKGD